ncbi:MAG: SDR family NAD(P)-dependent oxidoreductase [Deltaproteobacteria bacterium]|nr:SDR family NAD(P)-dependent oxidoreductase [Deltaproteobacteria bacterium]
MTELLGKKVIVTGGAMGIGLATCRRLVREGCDVTIWDLSQKDLDKAEKELKGKGGNVFPCLCDVSDKESVHELADQAKKDMGQVDILINNAGYVRHGMFWERPVEDAIKQIDVNVNALFYAIHEFLPDMLARNSGHIVNVSSGVAIASAPGLAAYTTSKWAVWGMTDVMRLEVMAAGKNGVKFTSVHPGNIVTGMFEGFKVNAVGRLIAPPVKNHDVIAKGLVEAGLKKNHHLVVRPRSLYLGMILRGLLPDAVLGRIALMLGVGTSVNEFKGRKGYIHSNPETESKK